MKPITSLVLGRHKLGPETIAITNAITRNEVCRVTADFCERSPIEESFTAMQQICNSLDAIPGAMNSLQMLVEKIERVEQIRRSHGRLSAGDFAEIFEIARSGRRVVSDYTMRKTLADAGYAVHKSDLGGYYFSDEFSTDAGSVDYVTHNEALEAAYRQITNEKPVVV